MSAGLLVRDAGTGKAVYTSENPRLQVAVDRTPPHLDRPLVTPTAIVTNLGNNYLAREILFKIKHGLGYKPRVLAYFLQSGTNRYDCGKSFFGFGAADDYVQYEVDEQNFYITHILADYFNAGLTSPATGTVLCKYLIFSNPVDNYTDPSKRV
jgi:hypothetical protein